VQKFLSESVPPPPLLLLYTRPQLSGEKGSCCLALMLVLMRQIRNSTFLSIAAATATGKKA
jgi:hypothetical protein